MARKPPTFSEHLAIGVANGIGRAIGKNPLGCGCLIVILPFVIALIFMALLN